MINYINAELYRILHKKSNLIYLAVIFIIFFALVLYVGTVNNMTMDDLNFAGPALISLLPIFVGIPVFMSVYNDDISAKNLSNVVSSGVNKKIIPLAKFIVAAIYLLAVFIFAALVFYALVFFAVKTLNVIDNVAILGKAVIIYLMTLGFIWIVGIITYAFQKSSLSTIAYVILPLGLVSQIVSLLKMLSKNLAFISDNTLTFHTEKAVELLTDSQTFDFKFIGIVAIYIVVSIALSTLIFDKNDVDVA